MKKALLLSCLALAISTLILRAQVAPPYFLFESVGDVAYTRSMDVNKDGTLDVVVATNERLFWLAQLEDGSYSRQNLIATTGEYYRTLRVADINEDGHDDLLYCTNESGLGVHFGTAAGTLEPEQAIYTPGSIIDFYLADLTGNGHLDIVLGRSAEARWLAGNGDGTFGPPQLLAGEHSVVGSVFAEDMNDDGHVDILLTASSSNHTVWYENLGGGVFGEFQLIEDQYSAPFHVHAADLDGDELPDLVCANWGEENEIGAGLVWYRNLGDGAFELADTLMHRERHDFIEVADLDMDGDLDIVTTYSLDEMAWLENDGNGNFGEPVQLEIWAAYLRFVEATDLNADGFPDLLYGINNSGSQKEAVLWRESTGGGEFRAPELITMGASGLGTPVVADIDNDGLKDIVAGSAGTDALVWLKNHGQSFSQPKLIARRHNYAPNTVAVADINNDGWLDVLSGSIQDDAQSVSDFCFYMNDGDGSFTASTPFPTFFNPQREMELVDVDHDGDLDMLWVQPGFVGQSTGAIGWQRNDGDSWSESIFLINNIAEPLDVLTTDFDSDGQLEIIVSKNDAPQIGSIEHIEDGTYGPLNEFPANFTAGLYAQAGDINGDGLDDLIATNDAGGGGMANISWWPNLGNGNFGSQQILYEGNPPVISFVYVDFDLDGRKDLVISTYYGDHMYWLRNISPGVFTDPIVLAQTPLRVRTFAVEDIDRDGDLDIIGTGDQDHIATRDGLFIAYNLANNESISGIIFYDENANGIQDNEEAGIGSVPIQVSPDALAVFSDNEGHFAVYGASGNYTLSPELEECWTLTTTPGSYEIDFDGSMSIDSLRFGVAPNTELPDGAVTLASAPTRCGFTVPFWLNYRNDGCWIFDGQAYLVLNDLATFVSSVPEPSSTHGDTLFWDFANLNPGTSRSIELQMTIAGVEFLGSPLEIASGIIPINASGQALPATTFDFLSVINCAYDPNDKLVYPSRAEQPPFTENYTLYDEKLLYTLRFQNTGTDTAFNIVLRDQLSPQLDWSTFEPGSSSHPYEATLHDDGLLEFHFRDILLVDSTTNEVESHGFVQFEIAVRPDVAEGTVIENSAGIYFDFNPPIITNTVENIIVEALPNFTPVTDFEYNTNELEATFTDASSNNPDTWFWEFGDGASSTEQNPTHTYVMDGTYTVCLTAGNAWGSAQYCEEVTITVTSVGQLQATDGIVLTPNPASTSVRVDCGTLPLPQKLSLYSTSGQVLRQILIEKHSQHLDVSSLPAGSYWIRSAEGSVVPLVIVK